MKKPIPVNWYDKDSPEKVVTCSDDIYGVCNTCDFFAEHYLDAVENSIDICPVIKKEYDRNVKCILEAV